MLKWTNCILFILLYTFSGCGSALETDPRAKPTGIQALLTASPAAIAALLSALVDQEKTLAAYTPATEEDLKRRRSLDAITVKIPALDPKAPERRSLMKTLSQISKDFDRRLEGLDYQQTEQETEQEKIELAKAFTQKFLKEIIEEALDTHKGIFGSNHEQRRQFWQNKMAILATQSMDDKQFVELIELAAQDIKGLTDLMNVYKASFPQLEGETETLPLPTQTHKKRRKKAKTGR